MKLKNFEFPSLRMVDAAFPSLTTSNVLLNIAKEVPAIELEPYIKIFNYLFFNGGKLHYKKNISEKFKNDCSLYLRCFMGSFAPKHEHKELISALLLSELVDYNMYDI